LLDHRDRLGTRAADAQLVIFARGFDRLLIRRAGQEGVKLVAAEGLFSPTSARR